MKQLLNKDVVVLVSTRTEQFLEYDGYLYDVNEDTITLKDASISAAMLSFQKNMFGNSIGAYKTNLETVIINKNYIISCHLK